MTYRAVDRHNMMEGTPFRVEYDGRNTVQGGRTKICFPLPIKLFLEVMSYKLSIFMTFLTYYPPDY